MYMYVYVCTCMYLYVYVYIYIYVCMNVYVCMCMFVCMYVCMYACTCVCVCVRKHACIGRSLICYVLRDSMRVYSPTRFTYYKLKSTPTHEVFRCHSVRLACALFSACMFAGMHVRKYACMHACSLSLHACMLPMLVCVCGCLCLHFGVCASVCKSKCLRILRDSLGRLPSACTVACVRECDAPSGASA